MKARDRIKLYCIARGISQRKLGAAARLAKQEVGHVGSGRYIAGVAVQRLAKAMGVTEEWLVRGRGPTPAWARPLIIDRMPAGTVPARSLERLADEVAQLRADVAWLKAMAGVDSKRARART